MTQPATPNSLIEALTLAMTICDAVPTRLHLSADETIAHIGQLVNAQPDGTHGYAVIRDALEEAMALADRAQRPSSLAPTVAGSIGDYTEFCSLLDAYGQALVECESAGYYIQTIMLKDAALAALIDYINARLAPAAPSGEAVAWARQRDLDRFSKHGVLVFHDSGEDWSIPLYTHPTPSSPTAPGQQAQAVPEGYVLVPVIPTKAMVAAGVKLRTSRNTSMEGIWMAMLAAQASAITPEGK